MRLFAQKPHLIKYFFIKVHIVYSDTNAQNIMILKKGFLNLFSLLKIMSI